MKKRFVVGIMMAFCIILSACGSDKNTEGTSAVSSAEATFIEQTEESHENSDLKMDDSKEDTNEELKEEPKFSNLDDVLSSVENEVNQFISAMEDEYDLLMTKLDTYDHYRINIDALDAFFEKMELDSDAFFDICKKRSDTYFKMALDQCDENKKLDRAFDDFYSTVYDDVFDDYYDGMDRLMKDIYDDIYEDLFDEAYDEIPYKEWTNAHSDFYKKYSDVNSSLYHKYAEARSRAYIVYSNMRSNAIYGDTRDFDTIMKKVEQEIVKKAEEEQRRKSQVDYEVLYEIRDGKAYVTGVSGEGNHLTISDEYENCEVIGIDSSAFEGLNIFSIVCWADIETIGDKAFKDCSELLEISIPSSTTVIGNSAFENCSKLESLVIWGSPDIGERAFANCVNITKVSIDSDTKKICDNAFDGCSELEYVSIWSDDILIGNNAFANCPKLEKVPKGSGRSVVLDERNEKDTQKLETDETDAIRLEFQKAMDEYVEFFKEYSAFVKKYSSAEDPYSLLKDYNAYMMQYVDTMEALEKLGNEEMTKEEQTLYLDTMNEIQKIIIDSVEGE